MRRVIAPLIVAGACAAAAATPANGAGATVRVADNVFKPKTVTITRGAAVTWRFVGDKRHNVVGKGFRSATMDSGTYKRRFGRSGTFRYRCTLHDGMTGSVVVR